MFWYWNLVWFGYEFGLVWYWNLACVGYWNLVWFGIGTCFGLVLETGSVWARNLVGLVLEIVCFGTGTWFGLVLEPGLVWYCNQVLFGTGT